MTSRTKPELLIEGLVASLIASSGRRVFVRDLKDGAAIAERANPTPRTSLHPARHGASRRQARGCRATLPATRPWSSSKVNVAMEALRKGATKVELASRDDVHPNLFASWKETPARVLTPLICQDTPLGDPRDGLAGAAVCHDALVDLAGREAFEAPDDLASGPAVSGPSRYARGWTFSPLCLLLRQCVSPARAGMDSAR